MEVLQGRMGLAMHGIERVLSADQQVVVPKNTPHRTWNAGDGELVLTSELRPALHSESFIETLMALGAQGKTNAAGVPTNLLQFATILNANYGEIFVTTPPIIVQKLTAKVLGGLGKWLGYKGHIPCR